MKLLKRYFRPYIITVVFCVIMLFIQAMCELNLPNFMSDIVNVGIQQNGVENAVPQAISEDGFTLMTSFMTDDEKNIVHENYFMVKTGGLSTDYDKYVNKYPLLKSKNIYILNTDEKDTISKLNNSFMDATATMFYTLKSISGNSNSAKIISDDMQNISFEKIYSLIPMIGSIDKSVIANARNDSKSLDENIVSQLSVMVTQQFYEEIGLDMSSLQSAYITRVGVYMIIITLICAVATVLVSLFASRIAAGVSKLLRRDVFKKVESFSNTEFDKFSQASLITRTTNDITQIQTVIVMAIRMLCYAPIMGIGGIIMALDKNPSMSWIIALGVLVLITIIVAVYNIAMPKFKIVQKLVDRLNLVTRENLTGMMVIRAFGNQEFEEERFDKANKDLTVTNKFINRVMAVMMPSMMFIMNSICLLIVWVGGHEIAASNMQVGDMMAFMQYSMQVIMSFLMISIMFIMIPRAAVSVDRISEVINTVPVIRDKKDTKKLPQEHAGIVEFKNVSFKYEDASEDVLSNINFVAKPGETTAFIGSTGSGKSTLINLIPRFYDVTEGQILIDGIDIRDLSQHDLRDNIGYVPQKGVLFSGNVNSNLLYGDSEASEADIKIAADVAQATEFIEKMPHGFESPISQGGTNVSGGQKQRLSIARALVKRAKIYIFDDSFSALDFKTDAALRKALKSYTANSTVLIVAQRVSTIMNAEQIIVLDEGKIVGKGTHKELLKSCKTYREIATSQLSKEELQ